MFPLYISVKSLMSDFHLKTREEFALTYFLLPNRDYEICHLLDFFSSFSSQSSGGFSLHHRHRPLCIPRCGQNLQLTYRKGRVGRYGLYLLSPLRGIEMSLSRFLIQEPFHLLFFFACVQTTAVEILTENWVLFGKE